MAIAKALAPQYYDLFECSGGSCTDNCCHSMHVKVDEKAYNAYKAERDEALRGRLLGNISVSCEDPFAARITMKADGDCPLLKPDGLCSVQLERGHDYLPYACRTYPRVYCNVGGWLEAYLSLSCEAAAMQALTNTEPMKLGETKMSFDTGKVFGSTLKPEMYTSAEDALDMFILLREVSIKILQNRTHKLWLRVVMLGFYIQQAGDMLLGNRENEIAGFSKLYLKSLEGIDDDIYSNVIPDRHEMKILRIFSFFEFIIDNRGERQRDRLVGHIGLMKEGLGIVSGKQPVRELIESFVHVRDSHYLPFFNNREHILENYLVNFVLSTGFPFTYKKEKNIYDNYIGLTARYAMLKFLLLGIAGYYKESLSESVVINVISAFSRFFDHDRNLADSLIDYFNSNLTTEMPVICMLVKD